MIKKLDEAIDRLRALPEERQKIVEEGFIPTVSTVEEAVGYAECVGAGERVPIHFVVDTGMGRIGLWEDEADHVLRAIREIPQLQMTALSTHLPVADEDENYTASQLQRFRAAARRLLAQDEPATVLNSAGVMRFGNQARPGDLVRVGLSVYGVSPLSEFQQRFRPAMTLKTRITLVRTLGSGRSISYGKTFVTPSQMTVATLGAGYGDGINRHLSGNPGPAVPVVRQGNHGPDRGRREPPGTGRTRRGGNPHRPPGRRGDPGH